QDGILDKSCCYSAVKELIYSVDLPGVTAAVDLVEDIGYRVALVSILFCKIPFRKIYKEALLLCITAASKSQRPVL
ncbi:MAG: hypothetical protein IJJ65_00250, partial [Butyrivibrio sp.]|nr:hypothetical protein [Butyrivibrio sp.]